MEKMKMEMATVTVEGVTAVAVVGAGDSMTGAGEDSGGVAVTIEVVGEALETEEGSTIEAGEEGAVDSTGEDAVGSTGEGAVGSTGEAAGIAGEAAGSTAADVGETAGAAATATRGVETGAGSTREDSMTGKVSEGTTLKTRK